MCGINVGITDEVVFLGSGSQNMVVSISASELEKFGIFSFSTILNKVMLPYPIVLRIGKIPQKECDECLKGLDRFVGKRKIISLTPELRMCIFLNVIPRCLPFLSSATEAMLLPDFTVDPASLFGRRNLAFSSLKQGAVGATLTADYTVEIKPKGAWRCPRVIGIEIDGKSHFIHPIKRSHCRYSQMQCYKLVQDDLCTEPETLRQMLTSRPAYCPNYFFRVNQSTREGLRRLAYSPQNHLRVVRAHPSRLERLGQTEAFVIGPKELDGLARALDTSGVAPALARLQIFGCDSGTGGCDDPNGACEVLDIELLHRWHAAGERALVRWLLDTSTAATRGSAGPEDGLHECGCEHAARGSWLDEVAPPYTAVSPSLDIDTCIRRFYVAATARDVSILASVSEPDLVEGPVTAVELNQEAKATRATCDPQDALPGVFVDFGFPRGNLYRIGVVDLDDKRHKTLEHYFERDAKIMKAFDLIHYQV